MFQIINALLISSVVSFISLTANPVNEIRMQIKKDIAISLIPPLDSFKEDSIYCYDELLKIDLDNNSNIKSIHTSDGASPWFSKEIQRMIDKNRSKLLEIARIAKKGKLQNCSILYPVVVASFGYSTAYLKQKAKPANFYKFNNKKITGNIFFGDPIELINSYHWRPKKEN